MSGSQRVIGRGASLERPAALNPIADSSTNGGNPVASVELGRELVT